MLRWLPSWMGWRIGRASPDGSGPLAGEEGEEGCEFKYQEFAMSSQAFPSSAARYDEPVGPAGTEIDVFTLLREVRLALQVAPIRQFGPHRRRRNAALARNIDAYLQRDEPTPLALAAEAAARFTGTPVGVMVDSGETHIVSTTAGVWLRARLLVDWDAILPLLANFVSSRYAGAIAALPETARQVFMLHRFGGLDLGEIASRFDHDISTCERLLAQALANIARTIDHIEQ